VVDDTGRVLAAIGTFVCAFASIPIGVGKLTGIRRWVEWAYPIVGLGAIVGGVGAIIAAIRHGVTLSSGDAAMGMAAAGVTGGVLLGVMAIGAVLSKVFHPTVYLPPGSHIGGVLAWIYSRKTFSRVFEPVLTETRNEWLEAWMQGHYSHAQWIQIRGDLLLLQNAVLQLLLSIMKVLLKTWKFGA
jgi:hypothetical protein